jgi:hypothetical protein
VDPSLALAAVPSAVFPASHHRHRRACEDPVQAAASSAAALSGPSARWSCRECRTRESIASRCHPLFVRNQDRYQQTTSSVSAFVPLSIRAVCGWIRAVCGWLAMSEPSARDSESTGESNGAEETTRARRRSRGQRPECLRPLGARARAQRVLVRKRGLEPPRSCERQPLKLVRLPPRRSDARASGNGGEKRPDGWDAFAGFSMDSVIVQERVAMGDPVSKARCAAKSGR